MDSSVETSRPGSTLTHKSPLGTKPRLAPKPFSLQKNSTIRSIHAPRTVSATKSTTSQSGKVGLPKVSPTPSLQKPPQQTTAPDSKPSLVGVLIKDEQKTTSESKKSPQAEVPPGSSAAPDPAPQTTSVPNVSLTSPVQKPPQPVSELVKDNLEPTSGSKESSHGQNIPDSSGTPGKSDPAPQTTGVPKVPLTTAAQKPQQITTPITKPGPVSEYVKDTPEATSESKDTPKAEVSPGSSADPKKSDPAPQTTSVPKVSLTAPVQKPPQQTTTPESKPSPVSELVKDNLEPTSGSKESSHGQNIPDSSGTPGKSDPAPQTTGVPKVPLTISAQKPQQITTPIAKPSPVSEYVKDTPETTSQSKESPQAEVPTGSSAALGKSEPAPHTTSVPKVSLTSPVQKPPQPVSELVKDNLEPTSGSKESSHGQNIPDSSGTPGKSDPTLQTTPPKEPLPFSAAKKEDVIKTDHKAPTDTVTNSDQKDKKKTGDETSQTQKSEESGSISPSTVNQAFQWGGTRRRLSTKLTSKFESGGPPVSPNQTITNLTYTKDTTNKPASSAPQPSPTTPEPPTTESNEGGGLDYSGGGSIKHRISQLFDSASKPEVVTKKEEPEIITSVSGVKDRIKNWAVETGSEAPKPQVTPGTHTGSFELSSPVSENTPKLATATTAPSTQAVAPSSEVSPVKQPSETPIETSKDAVERTVVTPGEHEQNKPTEAEVQLCNHNHSTNQVATNEGDSGSSLKSAIKRGNVKRRSVRFGIVETDDGEPPLILGSPSDSEEEEAPGDKSEENTPVSKKEEEQQKHVEYEKRRKAEEAKQARLKLEEERKKQEEEREKEKARQREELKRLEEEERKRERLKEEEVERQKKEEQERKRLKEEERERHMELMLQRQREEEERERARQDEEQLRKDQEEMEKRQRQREERRKEERQREERQRQMIKDVEQKLRDEQILIEKQKEEKLEEARVTKTEMLRGEDEEAKELEQMRQKQTEERLKQEEVERERLRKEAEERERERERERQRKLEEEEKMREQERQEEQRKRIELEKRVQQEKEEMGRMRQIEKQREEVRREEEKKKQLENERVEERERKMREELKREQAKELEEKLSGLEEAVEKEKERALESNLISFDSDDASQKPVTPRSPFTNTSDPPEEEILYDDFSVRKSQIEVDFDDFSVKPKRWGSQAKVETHPVQSWSKEEVEVLVPVVVHLQERNVPEPTPELESPEEAEEEEEEEVEEVEEEEKLEEEQLISMDLEEEAQEEKESEEELNTDEESDTEEEQVNSYCINGEDKDTDALIESEPDQQNGVCEHTPETDSPSPLPEHGPKVSPQDVDTSDFHREPAFAPFPESATPLLDTSAQRSKVDLGRRRSRTRPSRSLRLAQRKSTDWGVHDSIDGKETSTKQEDSDSEEEQPKAKIACSPSQRVPTVPGLSPAVLVAQLKRRTGGGGSVRGDSTEDGTQREEKQSQREEVAQSPPQPSRSSRTAPHLAGAARVLPSMSGTEGGVGSSPAWLKELKSRKRPSQYDSEA